MFSRAANSVGTSFEFAAFGSNPMPNIAELVPAVFSVNNHGFFLEEHFVFNSIELRAINRRVSINMIKINANLVGALD